MLNSLSLLYLLVYLYIDHVIKLKLDKINN